MDLIKGYARACPFCFTHCFINALKQHKQGIARQSVLWIPDMSSPVGLDFRYDDILTHHLLEKKRVILSENFKIEKDR